METSQTVNTPSSDYAAMIGYWDMIAAIMGGRQTMVAGGEKFLPKFESESMDSYKVRLEGASFTNIFRSIVEDLAARPFSKEVKVKSSTAMAVILENVDGQYTHVSKFMNQWFEDAIANGVSFVFVDYAQTNPNIVDASGRTRRKSVAEERASGARPYAIMVPARDAIAVYSAMINGVEEFVHIRFREHYKRIENFKEVSVEQVRVLTRDPIMDGDLVVGFGKPRFELWEGKSTTRAGAAATFKKVQEGTISLDRIPFTALVIGKRGNGWVVLPSMNDAAWLQRDHYEAQNGHKNLKNLTCFPMLSANGVDPPMGPDGKPLPTPVGPRAVLFTGKAEQGTPVGSWSIVEPSGASLSAMRDDVKDIAQNLRELGRQPLTANSSNLTVVTTVFAARQGNAAIQNWALDLKDSAENFLMFMALWMKDSQEPEVEMDLDFSLEAGEDDGFKDVLEMRSNGDLSQDTLWSEAQRRGRLSASFDPKKERKAIEEEEDGEGDDQDQLDAIALAGGQGKSSPSEVVPPASVPGGALPGTEDDVS